MLDQSKAITLEPQAYPPEIKRIGQANVTGAINVETNLNTEGSGDHQQFTRLTFNYKFPRPLGQMGQQEQEYAVLIHGNQPQLRTGVVNIFQLDEGPVTSWFATVKKDAETPLSFVAIPCL